MKKYEDDRQVSEEPDIEKFTVHYEDGTVKEFDKGFFVQMEKGDCEDTLTFHMAHCAGNDLRCIVLGCVKLAFEMGWIKD